MLGLVQPGEQGGVGPVGGRGLAVRGLEVRALQGQSIQGGGRVVGVAGEAQVIGPEGVGGDEEDVGRVRSRITACEGARPLGAAAEGAEGQGDDPGMGHVGI